VNLVDNVNLVSGGCRCVPGLFPEVPDLVDPPVAGSVYFPDIHMVARCDASAGIAFLAGVRTGTFLAVQRFGEYSGGGCLTHAPGTRHQVGVADPVVIYGVLECNGDVVLGQDFIEGLGPPFPGED